MPSNKTARARHQDVGARVVHLIDSALRSLGEGRAPATRILKEGMSTIIKAQF